jgi:hypothetical protein
VYNVATFMNMHDFADKKWLSVCAGVNSPRHGSHNADSENLLGG